MVILRNWNKVNEVEIRSKKNSVINIVKISNVNIISFKIGWIKLDYILRDMEKFWRVLIRRMVKLITYVKIIILFILGRVNC